MSALRSIDQVQQLTSALSLDFLHCLLADPSAIKEPNAMSNFYKYFKENMDSLGLPAPESLYGTLQMALANAGIFVGHIDKFGKAVTVAEVIGAGTKLEQLGVIGTLSASYYVGAVLGSLAVATGRTVSGGTSIADVLMTANRFGLNRQWLAPTLHLAPSLCDPRAKYNALCFHKNPR